jgi:hypothetical protein
VRRACVLYHQKTGERTFSVFIKTE